MTDIEFSNQSTRRVYAYEGDYQLVKEPWLVAIDKGEIRFL